MPEGATNGNRAPAGSCTIPDDALRVYPRVVPKAHPYFQRLAVVQKRRPVRSCSDSTRHQTHWVIIRVPNPCMRNRHAPHAQLIVPNHPRRPIPFASSSTGKTVRAKTVTMAQSLGARPKVPNGSCRNGT